MEANGYSTWLEIDLGAIRNNVRQLLDMTQTRVMAVVKADGYGHGALAVAKAATEAGATWCGVARLDEALALRHAGINSRILVMGYTPPDRIPDAIANNVSLTVYDFDVAHAYADLAEAQGLDVRVHAKVDTGMGRLGLKVEDAVEFLRVFHARPGVEVEGFFTHFARADEPQSSNMTLTQLQRFDELLETIDALGLRPRYVHAANSSGTIAYPQARYDLVRPGIALLGLDPSPEVMLPDSFKIALTWKAKLSSVKTLPPHHGISYGHTYYTQDWEKIGVVPVGYADGFRRVPGNMVLVEGKRVPVVGNVCMDQLMVRLDAIPEAKIGSEVVLLGQQKDKIISGHEIAHRWGTITYEVICGLATRLHREYINSSETS